ncbi:hypothetical protein F5887DRAFT_1286373 [Amanita rubescens]|nr:hypothetical protein F5887DRAFT_1286373 [Amanita rubescens]
MTNAVLTPSFVQRNASDHQCMTAMEGLLRTFSSTNPRSEAFQDLAIVLEQVLSAESLSSDASECQFCPLSLEIIRIVEHIRAKYDCVMRDIRGEFGEDLDDDFLMLKERLQSIMDVQEHKPTILPSSNAGMFDRARDLRIDGAKFANVAGNSTVDASSNLIIVIKCNSGIGFWSTLVLLILAFLVFRVF